MKLKKKTKSVDQIKNKFLSIMLSILRFAYDYSRYR